MTSRSQVASRTSFCWIIVLLGAFLLSSCTNDSRKTKVVGVTGAKPGATAKPDSKVKERGKNSKKRSTDPTEDESSEGGQAPRSEVVPSSNPVAPEVREESARPSAPVADAREENEDPDVEESAVPTRENEQAAEEPSVKESSNSASLKVQQMIAVLKGGHLVLSEATARHFLGVKSHESLSMSVLKEVAMHLAKHTRQNQFRELAGRQCDGTGDDRERPSKVNLSENSLELFLGECDRGSSSSTQWQLAMTAWFGPRPDQVRIELIHENLSSTKAAGIFFISAKGRCSFYYAPGDLSPSTLVQMVCGQSAGACGASQSNQLARYEGLAMTLPSSRPGTVEIGLFERIAHQTSASGEKSENKFYACGHRFEQKRTECVTDCLEKKNSVVGQIMKDGKLHIDHDFRAAQQEAYQRRQNERVQQQQLAAVSAIRKQNEVAQREAEIRRAVGEGQVEEIPPFEALTPDQISQLSAEDKKAYEQEYLAHQKAVEAYIKGKLQGAGGINTVPEAGPAAAPKVSADPRAAQLEAPTAHDDAEIQLESK